MTRFGAAGRSPFPAPFPRGGLLGVIRARLLQPAVAEFRLLLDDPIFAGDGVPRGDGRSVLVLPGLGAGDGYLAPLRGWLERTGYTPIPSGLARNPGWSERLVQELGDIAEHELARSGRQVTIIGHSMGGVLARSIAVRRPSMVRHVITLGSPLRMTRSRLPESVRFTAIYSKGDRVVRHPGAVARDPHAVNIEVAGTHSGLAFNPAVYRRLARLLPAGAPETL